MAWWVFVRMRRISRARWLTLGLAALWLTTQLSVFAHLALVPHVTCVEHGELIDAGAQPPGVAAGEAVEHDTAAALKVALAEHAHDHCLLGAMRRGEARLIRSTLPLVPSAAQHPSAAVRPQQPLPPAIALLDVAPKSSPPSA